MSERVDLLRASAMLADARAASSYLKPHPVPFALDILEALIAEAHESRRAVHNLTQHRDVAELLSTGPDVTELVDTVIDAAGRMMATVLELADAPRVRALEAEVHAAIKSRDGQIEHLKADRDMFVKHHERVLADQAASARHHIDELRDEIKTRAAVEQQRLEEINVLKHDIANLELALAEARGDVEA
jgi:ElaB/YqjD/DUF883 family membrane-anchored ribosome-binding protein